MCHLDDCRYSLLTFQVLYPRPDKFEDALKALGQAPAEVKKLADLATEAIAGQGGINVDKLRLTNE